MQPAMAYLSILERGPSAGLKCGETPKILGLGTNIELGMMRHVDLICRYMPSIGELVRVPFLERFRV